MSGYRRIQTGGSDRVVTEPLQACAQTVPLTGLATVVLSIWRMNVAAVEWYDFDDDTFKASGWTTRQQAMAELDATYSPGVYHYLWDTSAITNENADDTYNYQVEETSLQARNVPQEGQLDVGQWPDELDVAVSTRSSHTPADVDTTLTASHGAGSWQTATGFSTHSAADVDTQLSGTHGGGAWDDTATLAAVATLPTAAEAAATVMSSSVVGYSSGSLADTVLQTQLATNNIIGDITFIKDIEGGRWKIDAALNQMIFYKSDNTSEVARFSLFDITGSAGFNNPFERRRV